MEMWKTKLECGNLKSGKAKVEIWKWKSESGKWKTKLEYGNLKSGKVEKWNWKNEKRNLNVETWKVETWKMEKWILHWKILPAVNNGFGKLRKI